jgi:type VI secretion system secreted protein VgrG
VVGKSGEEIWTDTYGRIVVQFHWDRLGKKDEKSSCWIRVAQGWAGKSWGSVFIPRVGMEVIVSFLDGDPDQPIVSGCVYNAEQTVPYALPGEQTKSTIKSNSSKGGGGFNELRFEDKKGSEEVFIHAQKDLNLIVLNNETDTITQDRTVTVQKGNESLTVDTGNRTVTVTKGNDAHTVSTGNRTVTVSKGDDTHTISKGKRTVTVDAGDEAHTVGGKRDVKVTGAETHTNSDTFTHKSGGNYTLKVTGDLVIDATGNVTIKAGQGLTLKAGMGFVAEGGTSFSAKAGTAMAIEGGTTLDAKANASTTVQSSGIMTVKGSLVKIN